MDSQLIYLLLGIFTAGLCWKAAPVFAYWRRAREAGAPVRLLTVWWMYFRNVPLEEVVGAYQAAREAGVSVTVPELASHARAGGDVRAAVYAYVQISRAGTPIEFSWVCELDLKQIEDESSGLIRGD